MVGDIKGKSAIYIARVYGEKKIFRWPGLLSSRVFRVYCRGRNRDPGIHQEPGGGRRPFGATESLALTATFRWPSKLGSRQRPHQPNGRFEGSEIKPPGSALIYEHLFRGYTHARYGRIGRTAPHGKGAERPFEEFDLAEFDVASVLGAPGRCGCGPRMTRHAVRAVRMASFIRASAVVNWLDSMSKPRLFITQNNCSVFHSTADGTSRRSAAPSR